MANLLAQTEALANGQTSGDRTASIRAGGRAR
jgi:hypothetical protein